MFGIDTTNGGALPNNPNLRAADFGSLNGGTGLPNGDLGAMFSCGAIRRSFYRNKTHELSTNCRLVQDELKEDVDFDGEFGNNQGFLPDKLIDTILYRSPRLWIKEMDMVTKMENILFEIIPFPEMKMN